MAGVGCHREHRPTHRPGTFPWAPAACGSRHPADRPGPCGRQGRAAAGLGQSSHAKPRSWQAMRAKLSPVLDHAIHSASPAPTASQSHQHRLRSLAGEVLNHPRVDVVEQGVDGEVAAVRILLRRPKLRTQQQGAGRRMGQVGAAGGGRGRSWSGAAAAAAAARHSQQRSSGPPRPPTRCCPRPARQAGCAPMATRQGLLGRGHGRGQWEGALARPQQAGWAHCHSWDA